MNYLAMLSGIIVGIIIFQTGFITRTVFNHFAGRSNFEKNFSEIFFIADIPRFCLFINKLLLPSWNK